YSSPTERRGAAVLKRPPGPRIPLVHVSSHAPERVLPVGEGVGVCHRLLDRLHPKTGHGAGVGVALYGLHPDAVVEQLPLERRRLIAVTVEPALLIDGDDADLGVRLGTLDHPPEVLPLLVVFEGRGALVGVPAEDLQAEPTLKVFLDPPPLLLERVAPVGLLLLGDAEIREDPGTGGRTRTESR